MTWTPPSQGQAQQPQQSQQQAPQQGYGAPQPGYSGGPAPGGYSGPGAGQGYPQQPSGAVPNFNFSGRASLDESGPEMPYGDHILEVAGPREFVGQGQSMLVLPMKVIQTNNSEAADQTANWKRYLRGSHQATGDMIESAIARLVVPLSGRDKRTVTPQEVNALVQEFWHKGTLDGKPIVGMRVGATCSAGQPSKRTGKIHTNFLFHTL